MTDKLSIIIPVKNEEKTLAATLKSLSSIRQHCEIIVVDGGSTDASCTIAEKHADYCISSKPGRALQMNAGVTIANHPTLVFLHADTYLPENAFALIQHALQDADWGRFDVKLSGKHIMFRVIEFFINLRSRLSNIATGDQVIFVRTELFQTIGGYQPIALMEDVALCKSLRKIHPAACISEPVTTSSRRWEENGIWRTIITMWFLRLSFFLGMSPDRLAAIYYPTKK